MATSTMHVLVIDDDISIIRLIAESLKNDYSIVVATTAEEGLTQAIKTQPHLILLDVLMPEIDGFALCRALKADPKTQQIPIIFVSSLIEIDEQTRGFELGAVDYITKPIQVPILKARVNTHTRLYKQAQQLSTLAATDPLTNLANRRKFDEVLDAELKRSDRNGGNLSLLMIDIDDFKQYNDEFGHGKGDDCLIQVAKVLAKEACRAYDTVSRLGGEEFGIIIPEGEQAGSTIIAENILRHFAQLHLPHAANARFDYVTVSIGIAIKPNTTLSARAFLDMADKALYAAKANGRNQFSVTTTPIISSDAG